MITIRIFATPALALALAALPLPAAAEEDGPIQDNSFLIEEAYNQEPGVIQHIGTFARGRDGGWAASFTEEWPVLGQTHQLSVTVQAARLAGSSSGLGDVALNYRLQAVGSGDTAVAFAPRLSAILPTGDSSEGLGSGAVGAQVNLPLSIALHRYLVTHLNAGGTWLPSAKDPAGQKGTLTTFQGGGSLIALVHPKFNLMLEALYVRGDHALESGTVRSEALTVNPGVRAAIDVGTLQIVPGLAVPIGVGPSKGERAVFFYLSFEHPFWLAGPTEPEQRPEPLRHPASG